MEQKNGWIPGQAGNDDKKSGRSKKRRDGTKKVFTGDLWPLPRKSSAGR